MQVLKSHRNVNNSVWSLRFVRFMVTSCRAVVLPRFGGPQVLEVRPNVEVPDLKANEVLVRTRAVSINPLDTRVSEFSLEPILVLCIFLSLIAEKIMRY